MRYLRSLVYATAYFARRYRVLTAFVRVVLLVVALAKVVARHEEIRPIYATATVFSAAYNNLFHMVTK